MSTPFEELGLRAWADPDEIRAAYRAQVKKCHPDMVRDPAQKEAAQQRMIRLNLAYEEALRLASPRKNGRLCPGNIPGRRDSAGGKDAGQGESGRSAAATDAGGKQGC